MEKISYVADLLHRHNAAKRELKKLKVEMMRFAVEELNVDQTDAQKATLEVFLDGYLVGQGVKQAWR